MRHPRPDPRRGRRRTVERRRGREDDRLRRLDRRAGPRRGGVGDVRPVRADPLPGRAVGRLDPRVRHAVLPRRRRHRAGHDRAARGAGAAGDRVHLVHPLRRPVPRRARRGRLRRADARAAGGAGRPVRRDRRLPVLRPLRGHARPDVLHRRALRRGPAAVRRGQVLPVLVPRRPADARVDHRHLRGERHPARAGQLRLGDPAAPRRAAAALGPGPALPRLLRRVRDQGAAGAAAHLAARRRCRGADRRRRHPRRRPGQGRRLRVPALLPAAVPAGLAVPRAAGAGALGHRGDLRGAAGRDADRHEALRLLHLDRPLRVHRAGDLRVLPAGRRRVRALHGQPRHLDGDALPRRRHARRARRVLPDRRLRRRRAHRPGALRAVPRRRPDDAVAAGHELVRLGVPRADRRLPARTGLHGDRDRRDHLRGALRPLGLPAHHDRPAARRGRARRRAGGRVGRGAVAAVAAATWSRPTAGCATCSRTTRPPAAAPASAT